MSYKILGFGFVSNSKAVDYIVFLGSWTFFVLQGLVYGSDCLLKEAIFLYKYIFLELYFTRTWLSKGDSQKSSVFLGHKLSATTTCSSWTVSNLLTLKARATLR